jgi:hypothetical protein
LTANLAVDVLGLPFLEGSLMTSLVRMGIAMVQPIAERRPKCHDKARRPHEDEENAEDCGEFGEGHE